MRASGRMTRRRGKRGVVEMLDDGALPPGQSFDWGRRVGEARQKKEEGVESKGLGENWIFLSATIV